MAMMFSVFTFSALYLTAALATTLRSGQPTSADGFHGVGEAEPAECAGYELHAEPAAAAVTLAFMNFLLVLFLLGALVRFGITHLVITLCPNSGSAFTYLVVLGPVLCCV